MSLFGDYDVDDINTEWGFAEGPQEHCVITDAEIKQSAKGSWFLVCTARNDAGDEDTKWSSLPNSGDATKDRSSAKWLKKWLEDLEVSVQDMQRISDTETAKEILVGIEFSCIIKKSGEFKQWNSVTRIGGSFVPTANMERVTVADLPDDPMFV